MPSPSQTNGQKTGTVIYNEPDAKFVTNIAAVNFIKKIREEQNKGFGFVPCIGAGLSAPSGVPLIWEIKSYLERCIGLALGVEERGMRPWNPRTDAWPPIHDRKRSEGTDWLAKVREEFEHRRDIDRWDSEVSIFQEAIGDMAEWRSSLLFLSRLVREKRGIGVGEREHLAFDAPDLEVLDAGFRQIIRGKSPSLGHRMLASLADLLRLDIIVTTNFDDLLEQAFAHSRNPLTVSDLELNNKLPSVDSLMGQRALLKIHGGSRSLRADYSLDALPTYEDRWRFLQYLLTGDSRQDLAVALAKGAPIPNLLTGDDRERLKETLANGEPIPIYLKHQNHLIVMGLSAAERRTRALISHAWTHLGPQFKVFWLCYSVKDVEGVEKFTSEYWEKKSTNREPVSHVLRFPDQGLFFLQLFQTLRYGLPSSGIVFPSVSRLPMPPLLSRKTISDLSGNSDDDTNQTSSKTPDDYEKAFKDYQQTEKFRKRLDKFRDDILERIKIFQGEGFRKPKLMVIGSKPGVSGMTGACARAFELLEQENVCLWFDMNDISSTSDLFEKLLDAAYFRLGEEHWMPVHITDDPTRRMQEMHRLVNLTPKNWVIFLNARETPAANSLEPIQVLDEVFPNSWIDGKPIFKDGKEEINSPSPNFSTEMTPPPSSTERTEDETNDDEFPPVESPSGETIETEDIGKETQTLSREDGNQFTDKSSVLAQAIGSSGTATGNTDTEADEAKKKEEEAKKKGLLEQRNFVEMLAALAGHRSRKVSVILMCRHRNVAIDETSPHSILEQTEPPIVSAIKQNKILVGDVHFLEEGYPFEHNIILQKILDWAFEKITDVNLQVALADFSEEENPEAAVQKEQTRERLRFLHILCLMQRTRYLSTIWSHELFVTSESGSKSRGTVHAQLFQEDRQDWLSNLEERRLVRRTAGGFIWVHSRLRSELRTIFLDGEDEKDLKSLGDWDDNKRRFILDWKKEYQEAEFHAGLALWYRDVLLSSSSPAALFEAVYHASRSALKSTRTYIGNKSPNEGGASTTAPYSSPDHHLDAVEQLDWASAQLRTYLFLAQTRGFSRDSCRVLTSIRDTNCSKIDEVLKDSANKEEANRIREANRRLKTRCTETMRAIGREVGEITRAYDRHRELGTYLLGKEPDAATLPPSLANELFEELRKSHRDNSQRGRASKSSKNPAAEFPERWKEFDLEWLRWWRWNSMLAIEARAYQKSRSALFTALTSIIDGETETQARVDPNRKATEEDTQGNQRKDIPQADLMLLIERGEKKILAKQLEICGHKGENQPGLRLELCRILEQALDCLILQIGLDRRLGESETLGQTLPLSEKTNTPQSAAPKQEDADRDRLLRICLRVANTAVEQFLSTDSSLNSRYNHIALWCKARIKMHQSIHTILCAQSRRSTPNTASTASTSPNPIDVEWELALGYLSGAEACLNNSDANRQESDLAIVELFRADVRLRQADCNIVNADGRSFSDLRLQVYKYFYDNKEQCQGMLWKAFGVGLREDVLIKCDNLNRSRALVEDSIRFLNRAEEILRGRRRNVWWTTWLFERRLRAIALLIWSTAHEKNGTIPYLGMDSSPRETDTIADILLDNCIRMVRMDAFRLASVVDAYAECAFALRVRLLCDPDLPLMPHRQKAMRYRLQRATNILKLFKEVRSKHDVHRSSPLNWKMENDVNIYIDRVRENAKSRIEFLKIPLE